MRWISFSQESNAGNNVGSNVGGVLFLVALLTITACTPAMQGLKQRSLESVQTAHHKKVRLLDGWEMAGKLYLRYGDKKWRFRLSWQCQPQPYSKPNYAFSLSDVGGRKIAQFKGTSEFAEVRNSKGEIKRAANSSLLMREMFGLEAPSAVGLCEWLVGLPSDLSGIDRYQTDAYGRLTMLAQSGWQMSYTEYSGYRREGLELDLPSRILFEKGKVHLRVEVSEWKPNFATRQSRLHLKQGLGADGSDDG